MVQQSTSTIVLVLAAVLGAAPLAAQPAQSALQAQGAGRALQSPSAPSKVVIPTVPSAVIPISSLPFDIDKPGYYQLTKDLGGVPGQHGIRVFANDVFIDMNGFLIGGGGATGTLAGIRCFSSTRVTVFNGLILGWNDGGITSSSDCAVINVWITANKPHALELGPGSVVQDCRINGNAAGIVGSGIRVSGCRIHDNAGDGIHSPAGGLVVSHCIVTANQGSGIRGIEPDSNDLGQNPCVVEDCEVTDNGINGMELPSFSQVRRSVVRDNPVHGIAVGESSHVTDCLVSANGIALRASSGSHVEGCVVRFNTLGGIDTGPASTVVDCESVGNQGPGVIVGGPSIVRGCTVVGNDTGIEVQGIGGRVEGCSVSNNQGAGICVQTSTLVADNDVAGNQGRGILATGDGTRIDGNHLAGNVGGIEVQGTRSLIVRNSLDSNGVQTQIAADNVQGPLLKSKGFIQVDNPWANFDLSFPETFP